jgi:four helix bundle protein
MTEPSESRRRTLALQARALNFSTKVLGLCPLRFSSVASETVWRQLVRAADSVSNSLGEADDASSTADFLHKIRLTLRETKESRQCLAKVRLASLDRCGEVAELEREAGELCAIFATISMKVSQRMDREAPRQLRKLRK